VAFGGADFKTMYITARTSIYKVQVKVAGEKPVYY
jgi:sugar lactone lactonase YvrE